jgi:23S rRNA pseudouridine955/2504/2580 synthase
MREFLVGDDEAGSRLETFLRQQLGLSRPTALKAMRKGWVRVDGKRARKGSRRLTSGEQIKITNYALPLPFIDDEPPPLPPVPEHVREAARLSIRLEDSDVVVVAKPAGQVVHKGTGHDYGWCDAVGHALGGAALTPIGRLDRDTSGLLLLARHRGASRRLFAGLRDGSVQRTYVALVIGRLPGRSGRIELALRKEGEHGAEQMRPNPEGQEAITLWRTRQATPEATLVEVELETGRTHQIRAHFHARGHAVLGDPRYDSSTARALSKRLALERLFLHAERLTFPHPTRDEVVKLNEPLPRELNMVLRAL